MKSLIFVDGLNIVNQKGEQMKSRDRIVEAGEQVRKHPKHRHPWIYFYKVKSGRNKTRNVESMHFNMIDLNGYAVERFAKNEQDFAIYGLARVLRSSMRSKREDV